MACILMDLPDVLLHRVLRTVGPHTRQVCHRFCEAYHSTTRAMQMRSVLGGLRDPAASLAMLQRLSCLPSVQRFACSQDVLGSDSVEMAGQLVASRSTCLRELRVECRTYEDMKSRELLAALQQHATSLAILAGIAVATHDSGRVVNGGYTTGKYRYWGSDCDSDDEEATVQRFDSPLLQLTALRELHVMTWQGAPARALSKLTQLTKLAFHPWASADHSTTPFLQAASQLPNLLSLELPADEVSWYDAGHQLLSTLTQLSHLQVGGWKYNGIITATAALTNLRSLVLVNTDNWEQPASLDPLTALSLLRSFGLHFAMMNTEHLGEYLVGDHINVARLEAMGSSIWPLTSLKLLAATVFMDWFDFESDIINFTPGSISKVLPLLAASLQELHMEHMVLPVGLFGMLATMPHLKDLHLRHCFNSSSVGRGALDPAEGLQPVCCHGLQDLTSLTALTITVDIDLLYVDSDDGNDEVGFNDGTTAAATELCAAEAQGRWTSAYPSKALQQIACLASLQRLSLAAWELSAAELANLVGLEQLQHLTMGRFAGDDTRAACAVLRQGKALKWVASGHSAPKSYLLAEDIWRLAA